MERSKDEGGGGQAVHNLMVQEPLALWKRRGLLTHVAKDSRIIEGAFEASEDCETGCAKEGDVVRGVRHGDGGPRLDDRVFRRVVAKLWTQRLIAEAMGRAEMDWRRGGKGTWWMTMGRQRGVSSNGRGEL